jgi:hypothetical protein
VLTPDQEKFKDSLETVGLNKVKRKINSEADYAKKNPTPEPGISAENALAFGVSVATNLSTLAIYGTKVIIKQTPKEIIKLIDKAKQDINAPAVETAPNSFGLHISKKPLTQRMRGGMTEGITEDMTEDITEDMIGGIKFSKPSVKRFNKMLFNTAYIPGILTLFAFLFLLFYLLWTLIQWALNKILSFLGSNKQTLPSIKFNKKTTQTIYSIFFVITSWFLMLYLFIDYFRNVGPELDIIQILKQLIGASYILWPMAVLVIGSGISKAFYKISCSGNKPNVLSWAKIVESSALYVLGIAALITVMLLFKPVKYIYEKIPELVQKRFLFITVMVAVSLKLMVIYILLRMITIMIEDVISNKIVFFISKFNKDVEAPPVDCNVETKKTAKQSEIAKILEEIYMYISGIIVCIIAIFILVIQCPHPYMASTSKINNTIGAVFLQLTDIATRFIVENRYAKKTCSQKNKGSGLFKTPSWFSSLGKTGPKLDNSGVTGYINKFKETAPKSEQSTANENNTLDPKDISVSIREGLTPEVWDRKHFTPTPPATAEVTRIKNGRGTTPPDKTFDPRDTPILSATTTAETSPNMSKYMRPSVINEIGKLGVGYIKDSKDSDGMYNNYPATISINKPTSNQQTFHTRNRQPAQPAQSAQSTPATPATRQGIDINGPFSGLASQVSGETANPDARRYRDTTPVISEDDTSTRRY